MSRRTGVTLVEVLVAIFVMGIGLIALLTLFPIGMIRMARAIHDERCAQCVLNAHANALAYGIAIDSDVVSEVNDVHNQNMVNADLFKNPCPFTPVFPGPALPLLLPAADYGDSYPLLVDPIGFNAVPNGTSRRWVGSMVPTTTRGGLRRREVRFTNPTGAVTPLALAQKRLNLAQAFTLWDDLVWEPVNVPPPAPGPGSPQKFGGGATAPIGRDTRFSWAYTLWRPQTWDKSVVDCSIIVFDSRTLSLTGTGTLSEHVYPDILRPADMTFFNPDNNTISIEYTGAGVGPPLRPNDWILDVTPFVNVGGAHCYWYRIVAAEDLIDTVAVPNRRFARFEVAQPIRGVKTFPISEQFATFGGVSTKLGYPGTSVVLEGVADVFPKGPIRLPWVSPSSARSERPS